MLRNPLFIKCAARAANALLRLLFMTCRVKIRGLENLKSKQKLILMLWHNRITIAPQILRRYTKGQTFTALVSNSRDGAYVAEMVHAYSRGRTIRVPHDLRHEALRTVVRQLKETQDIIIITPDGPRGPKYEVKGGILFAAKAAQAAIVPMTWSADRYWEFNTWDRMILPKPFSTITVSIGEPLQLESGTNDERAQELKEALTALEKNWV